MTLGEMRDTYGPGCGGDLFCLLRAAGGTRVRTVRAIQSPCEASPPPDGAAMIGEQEEVLANLEARLQRSPSAELETDDEDEDEERPRPGSRGRMYEFDVGGASDDERAQVEWGVAQLAALVTNWGGAVNVERAC